MRRGGNNLRRLVRGCPPTDAKPTSATASAAIGSKVETSWRAGGSSAPEFTRRSEVPKVEARLTPSVEHEAVAVDGLDARAGGSPSSPAAAPAIPLANATPSGPTSSTASPGLEAALARGDADGEQARPVARRARAARPRRRASRPATGLPKRSQSLNADGASLGGREARAARLAGEDRHEHRSPVPAGDHGRDPGGGGQLGGEHLARACRPCRAALLAPSTASPRAIPVEEQLGARRAGRARVDALDLGEQHEQPARAASTATCAASASLSPKVISSVAVASFSFTTGTAPSSNSASSALRAFT